MQAILTRYHGPTNTRGSRITAKAEAGRTSVAYDHALNYDQNHRAAALALMAKVGWEHDLASGTLPGGDGCHVLIHRD